MNVIFHGLCFLFSKSMIAFRYISWRLLIYKLKSIEFKSTKKFLKNQIIMSMKTILILVMQHSGRNYEKGFFFFFQPHFFSITGRHLLFFFFWLRNSKCRAQNFVNTLPEKKMKLFVVATISSIVTGTRRENLLR